MVDNRSTQEALEPRSMADLLPEDLSSQTTAPDPRQDSALAVITRRIEVGLDRLLMESQLADDPGELAELLYARTCALWAMAAVPAGALADALHGAHLLEAPGVGLYTVRTLETGITSLSSIEELAEVLESAELSRLAQAGSSTALVAVAYELTATSSPLGGAAEVPGWCYTIDPLDEPEKIIRQARYLVDSWRYRAGKLIEELLLVRTNEAGDWTQVEVVLQHLPAGPSCGPPILQIRADLLPVVDTLLGSPLKVRSYVEKIPELSEREIEVLKLLSRGLTAKEAARELGLSPKTVETHRNNIRRRTGIGAGRAELIRLADRLGVSSNSRIPRGRGGRF